MQVAAEAREVAAEFREDLPELTGVALRREEAGVHEVESCRKLRSRDAGEVRLVVAVLYHVEFVFLLSHRAVTGSLPS